MCINFCQSIHTTLPLMCIILFVLVVLEATDLFEKKKERRPRGFFGGSVSEDDNKKSNIVTSSGNSPADSIRRAYSLPPTNTPHNRAPRVIPHLLMVELIMFGHLSL